MCCATIIQHAHCARKKVTCEVYCLHLLHLWFTILLFFCFFGSFFFRRVLRQVWLPLVASLALFTSASRRCHMPLLHCDTRARGLHGLTNIVHKHLHEHLHHLYFRTGIGAFLILLPVSVLALLPPRDFVFRQHLISTTSWKLVFIIFFIAFKIFSSSVAFIFLFYERHLIVFVTSSL